MTNPNIDFDAIDLEQRARQREAQPGTGTAVPRATFESAGMPLPQATRGVRESEAALERGGALAASILGKVTAPARAAVGGALSLIPSGQREQAGDMLALLGGEIGDIMRFVDKYWVKPLDPVRESFPNTGIFQSAGHTRAAYEREEHGLGELESYVVGMYPSMALLLRDDAKALIRQAYDKDGPVAALGAAWSILGQNYRDRPNMWVGEKLAKDVLIDPLNLVAVPAGGASVMARTPVVGKAFFKYLESPYMRASNAIIDVPVSALRNLPKGPNAKWKLMEDTLANDFRLAMADEWGANTRGATERQMQRIIDRGLNGDALTPSEQRVMETLEALGGGSEAQAERVLDIVYGTTPQEAARIIPRMRVQKLRRLSEAERRQALVKMVNGETLNAKELDSVGSLARRYPTAAIANTLLTLDGAGGFLARQAERIDTYWRRPMAGLALMGPDYLPGNIGEDIIRTMMDGVSPGWANMREAAFLLGRYDNLPREVFSQAGLSEVARAGVDPGEFSALAEWARRTPPGFEKSAKFITEVVNSTVGPKSVSRSGPASQAIRTHFLMEVTSQEVAERMAKSGFGLIPAERDIAMMFTNTPMALRDLGAGLPRALWLAAPHGKQAIRQVADAFQSGSINRKALRGLVVEDGGNLPSLAKSILNDLADNAMPADFADGFQRAREAVVQQYAAEPDIIKHTMAVARQALEQAAPQTRRELLAARREALMVVANLEEVVARQRDVFAARAAQTRTASQRAKVWERYNNTMADLNEFVSSERAAVKATMQGWDDSLKGRITRAERVALDKENRARTTLLDEMEKLNVAAWNEDTQAVAALRGVWEGRRQTGEFYDQLRYVRERVWLKHTRKRTEAYKRYFEVVEQSNPSAAPRDFWRAAEMAREATDFNRYKAHFDSIQRVEDAFRARALNPAWTPDKELTLRQWLEGIASKYDEIPAERLNRYREISSEAAQAANLRYKNAFANYEDTNILDDIVRVIDPYWVYQTRRWGWIGRQFLTKPGFAAAFAPEGKWWRSTEQGYATVPNSPFQANVLAGTVGAPLRRLFLPQYPAMNAGALGTWETWQRTGQRLGVNVIGPTIALPGRIVANWMTPDGRLNLGAELPTPITVSLDLLQAVSPGVMDDFISRVFADPFEDYTFRQVLLQYDGSTVEDWEGREHTPEYVNLKRTALAVSTFTSLLPQLRYRTSERERIRAELDAIIAEDTGIPAETVKAERDAGRSVLQYVQLSPAASERMQAVRGVEAFLAMTEPLTSPQEQRINQMLAGFYDRVDELRLEYKGDPANPAPHTQHRYDQQLLAGQMTSLDWHLARSSLSGGLAKRIDGMTQSADFREAVLVPEDVYMSLTPEEREAVWEDGPGRYYMRVPLSSTERNIYRKLTGSPIPALNPVRQAIDGYYQIRGENFMDGLTGQMDVGAFYRARNEYLQRLPESLSVTNDIPELGISGSVTVNLREQVLAYISRNETALEQRARTGRTELMGPWYDTDVEVGPWLRSLNMEHFARFYEASVKDLRRLVAQRDLLTRDNDLVQATLLTKQISQIERQRDTITRRYRENLMATHPQRREMMDYLRLFDSESAVSFGMFSLR